MISAGGCEAQYFCENDRVFKDQEIGHRMMESFKARNTLSITDVRNLDDDPFKVPDEDITILTSKISTFVGEDWKWRDSFRHQQYHLPALQRYRTIYTVILDINHVESADSADQPTRGCLYSL